MDNYELMLDKEDRNYDIAEYVKAHWDAMTMNDFYDWTYAQNMIGEKISPKEFFKLRAMFGNTMDMAEYNELGAAHSMIVSEVETKLKPCPFCGNKFIMVDGEKDFSEKSALMFECLKCHTTMWGFDSEHGKQFRTFRERFDHLVQKWNCRTV